MKRNIFLLAFLLSAFQLINANDVITKDINSLPAKAKTTLSKHFPNNAVSYVKIDKEVFSTDYEVVFTNGSKIKFDGKGEWTKIDGNKTKLPDSIVPTAILTYVKTTFPESAIEQIEKENWGYEVELLNDLDLKFNKSGKFITAD